MKGSPCIAALCAGFVSLCAGVATAQQAPAADTNRVEFTMKLGIQPQAKTRRVTLDVLVPQTREGCQEILGITYSVPPVNTSSRNGNRYVRFVFDRPEEGTELTVTVEALLYRNDFETASARRTDAKKGLPERSLGIWKAGETYLEKEDPEIKEAAKGLVGADDLATVRKTMEFVVAKLDRRGYDPRDHGAVAALRAGGGDCSEFSDLFVALCRANGIPARICEGYAVTRPAENDTAKHTWAEVYFPDMGWVAFDPIYVKTGNATFERMRPIYVTFSNERNDKVLAGYHLWCYWYDGAEPKITEEFTVAGWEDAPRGR
jgi:transglutaminase-like putative cysteine protease